MTLRACILQHDQTTVGGMVLDGLDDVSLGERKLSYLGAQVLCPVCKGIGHIDWDSPRPEDSASGKQFALEGDFCRCGCASAPRLVASQHEWMVDA